MLCCNLLTIKTATSSKISLNLKDNTYFITFVITKYLYVNKTCKLSTQAKVHLAKVNAVEKVNDMFCPLCLGISMVFYPLKRNTS